MKISGIDFPKPLLNAWRDGNLVVFAGAGVSMGKPALLPSFTELAKLVARGTVEKLNAGEPEDRFLGRLHHNCVKVHTRAVDALAEKNPQPTDLHRNLLKLYFKTPPVRIVTTNFDTLFEQAARGQCGLNPEVFTAPLLPLGGEFNGIVHIHGTLDSPDQIVLTDADFGRAYLTEGWARRFLVELFRSFTVLFVGYSHNDVVLNYLARALAVAETNRFALTRADEDEATRRQWQLLGIERIDFPKTPVMIIAVSMRVSSVLPNSGGATAVTGKIELRRSPKIRLLPTKRKWILLTTPSMMRS